VALEVRRVVTAHDESGEGIVVADYNYVGSGQGTTVRIVEWVPGYTIFPHRTETMDYSIVLLSCAA
jgi:hypothetical protein